MVVKFLDLQKQYLGIKEEVDRAIFSVIEKAAFVGGEAVESFEAEFSRFIGNGVSALGVANGSDALEIALEALELPKGSEVLVPANTFAATAEAVARNGLKIVFVDCGADYTMDIGDLESKITERSSAIVAVHLYGQSARMQEILELAKRHSLKVVEDCAQAHGAKYRGVSVGSLGDIAAFSFYPGKNLGAYGDGGAIVSRDSSLLEKCKCIAHHGGLKKYEHRVLGRNSRLDSIQAAILQVKLKYLESWNQRRREVAGAYLQGLRGVILPEVREECECVWHLFVIRTKGRDELMRKLKERGIETGLHYPICLPNTPAFSNRPYVVESQTPNASAWEGEILSLPMGEHLSDEEVAWVIESIKDSGGK